MKYIVSFLAILSFFSCNSTRKATSPINQYYTNNVVINEQKDVTISKSSGGKLIFEGSNNLIEVIQKNVTFFDQCHDVIIIQGNNNSIKLYNTNIVDLRGKGSDTCIIVGNHQKYIVDFANAILIQSKHIKTDTIKLSEPLFKIGEYSNDFRENADRVVTLKYFNEPVSIKYAFDYFTAEIKSGNIQFYYELAELYLYGIGTEISTAKAINLYEYAAVKNHVLSIRQLGDIYANGTFDYPKNLKLAVYYYKVGSQLGDTYCKDMLSNK
ncbi:tetratricopeptide repeat protein [Xanthocytophaga agilis]|uniref:Tetratricopeptide repeat protein n=1 Tax=Xanthocytophaga agilis TaxID=3048010 RepID=A0AAE3RBX3_9BACT|nr:tetratricopeptide repeat protein [Xanthocytophaga agilis]MDJ1504668.1 tetratricopeptide repeat protein [Xanthocytophaga agilis]